MTNKRDKKVIQVGKDPVDGRLDLWESDMKRDGSGQVFDETPVPLNEFLYSSSYLGIEKLSPIQYDFIKVGTCIYKEEELRLLGWLDSIGIESSKEIGESRKEDSEYTVSPMADLSQLRPIHVGELVAWWGKGSGKDFCSSIILSRIANELLCLHNPQKYFDQSKVSSIDMLNMAYNGEQAQTVFFKTFSEMINQCKWFNDKCEVKPSSIQFAKRICAYSGNSFEEAFEGKNLIVAVLDEISAFKTRVELESMAMRRLRAPRYSAESVYDMAKSSIASRFPKGIGKIVSLSFSRFKNDYIEQLYERGKNDITCYVSKGCTWEVNPYRSRDDFNDEFRKNPERAESRYACNPSSVEGGYFKDKEKVKQAFPVIDNLLCPTNNDDITPTLTATCNHNFLCSVHIDLGLRKDKAGIAMSHVSGVVEEVRSDEVGNSLLIELPVVTVDFATSFIAPVGGEIDLSKIRQIIIEVVTKGWRVGIVTLDSFQSADFIQILSKLGIPTATRSVDRSLECYDCLKELIYEGRLKGYSYVRKLNINNKIFESNEIVTEALNLMLIGGRKVDHPAYGSKDVIDAIAGSVKGAIEFGMVGSETPMGIPRNVAPRVVDMVRNDERLLGQIVRTQHDNHTPGNVGYRGLPR